jgi:Transposase, Mutator family
VQGVSTRGVDELVKALGMSGISWSQLSRLCAEIDERVQASFDRPIEASGLTSGSLAAGIGHDQVPSTAKPSPPTSPAAMQRRTTANMATLIAELVQALDAPVTVALPRRQGPEWA